MLILKKLNNLLYPIFKSNTFQTTGNKISEFGLNNRKVSNLIQNKFEGNLNSGKLIDNLLDIATSLGIRIYFGCELTDFEEHENHVSLLCKSRNSELRFKGEKLIICTNGFTSKLIPNLRVKPARGCVLVTKPIKNLKIKGSFHYNEGYFYFRNIKDRVMFGGGRNIDISKEETYEFGVNKKIIDRLKKDLEEIIIPDNNFEIDMIWSGIMGFGETKEPIIRPYSKNIWLAVALGGMGIAIGSLAGKEIAEWVYG